MTDPRSLVTRILRIAVTNRDNDKDNDQDKTESPAEPSGVAPLSDCLSIPARMGVDKPVAERG